MVSARFGGEATRCVTWARGRGTIFLMVRRPGVNSTHSIPVLTFPCILPSREGKETMSRAFIQTIQQAIGPPGRTSDMTDMRIIWGLCVH